MIKKNSRKSSMKSIGSSYQRPHDKWQEIVLEVDGTDDGSAVVSRKTRSLRWRRWMFTLSVTAFTFGAMMIGLGTPSIRNELLAPGDLCSSHAQILAGQGADRCAACHPGGHDSFSQWTSTALLGPEVDMPTQSQLCMKCHEQSIDSQWAMNPHSVDPATLSTWADGQTVSIADRIKGLARLPAPTHAGEIACSVCHREHHGSENDLTELTDQQCQVCHQQAYHSFEIDHPPLDNYPLKRRSSIAFDHASHSGKHFPGAKQAFDCAKCHVADGSNSVQKLASFEQSCAECHQQKIEVMSEPGLALLALPTLDMTAIEAQGANVGGWPLAATGDFDGPLPPVMRLLLLSDPEAKKVLDQKDVQFDFSDLDPDEAKDVADSVTLVWSIKRLMFELARDGQPAIARRIKEVTGVQLDSAELQGLASALEASVFQGSANRWLPDLKAEVGGQVPDYPEAAKYKLEASGSLLAKQDFEWSSQTLAALQDQPERDGSEWLAKNPLAGDGVAATVSAGAVSSGQSGDAKQAPVAKVESSRAPTAKVKANQAKPASVWQPNDKSAVGWVRDDGRFQLRYQPTGHADGTLKSWIDLVGRISVEENESDDTGLFGLLMANEGMGDCRRCHTADRQGDGRLLVNWGPEYRDPTVASFTRFSHGPHLTLPQLRDCSGCHQMNSEQGNQDSFVGFDPQEFHSNFAALTVSDCASCHRSGSTSNSCTQCHNYHVGMRSE